MYVKSSVFYSVERSYISKSCRKIPKGDELVKVVPYLGHIRSLIFGLFPVRSYEKHKCTTTPSDMDLVASIAVVASDNRSDRSENAGYLRKEASIPFLQV